MKQRILIKLKKLVFIIIIFILSTYIFMNTNEVKAVVQSRVPVSDELENYPGYTELLNKLKEAHPNWNFTILYTGLDWNQVIKGETTDYHGRNLVSSTRPSSWVCSVCKDKLYDTGKWKCASEAAVSYYMDPRNSLNEQYVFQFEALSYNEEIQTIEGVLEIIKDVKYMQGDKITYTKTDGTLGTIEKTYAQVIMEAAQEAKISPYHLAARIRQEQGVRQEPGTLASGTYEGFVGYYNFLNIRASGGTEPEVIKNGLTYAKEKELTDPELSIKWGAKFLAKDYIGSGQDTLYLQKFDVDASDGSLYSFQYMQNVSAAKSEAVEVKESYEELGMLNSKIDFIIPVYENMPELVCPEPVEDGVVTQNIKIKGNEVTVRNGQGTNYEKIAVVNAGDILLRIQMGATVVGDYYWDKVVLPDGTIGYIAREYIEEIEDVTNCNDSLIVKKNVNLRNGPGTGSTTVITTLQKGQLITRIETGKYNGIDGENWDRVVLADGRQGYVAQSFIGEPGDVPEGEACEEIIKVICNSGLKVREEPGIDKIIKSIVLKEELLTRIEKNVSDVDGYIWDKVVTRGGIEGYIARGDSKEDYIELVENDNNTTGEQKPEGGGTTEETPNISSDKFKLESEYLICIPETTVEDIRDACTEEEFVIKNSEGKVIETGNIATGNIIVINNKEYNIINYGDVNGDGLADEIDLLLIKRKMLQKYNLEGVYLLSADLNKDELVDEIDLLLQKRYLLKSFKITL